MNPDNKEVLLHRVTAYWCMMPPRHGGDCEFESRWLCLEAIVGIVSMLVAIASMLYAAYLHIYYHRRVRALRDIEIEKYKENMAKLGYSGVEVEESLHQYTDIASLCEANRRMTKAARKYKL